MPDRALEAALNRPISEIKADLFRALGHPARVRILEILVDGECSVGEMQPLVGIEASHLSQQLAVLRRAGVVTTRKEGSSVIYAVSDRELGKLLASAKRLLVNQLAKSQALLDDLQSSARR